MGVVCKRRPHPHRTGTKSQFSEDRCWRCACTHHLGNGFISRCACVLSEGRTQGGLGSSRLRRGADVLLSPETLSRPFPWVCSPGPCAVTAWAARHEVRPCQGPGQTCTWPTSRVRGRRTGYTLPPPHTPGRRRGQQPLPGSFSTPSLGELLVGRDAGKGGVYRGSLSTLAQSRRANPGGCQPVSVPSLDLRLRHVWVWPIPLS